MALNWWYAKGAYSIHDIWFNWSQLNHLKPQAKHNPFVSLPHQSFTCRFRIHQKSSSASMTTNLSFVFESLKGTRCFSLASYHQQNPENNTATNTSETLQRSDSNCGSTSNRGLCFKHLYDLLRPSGLLTRGVNAMGFDQMGWRTVTNGTICALKNITDGSDGSFW